MTYFIKNKAHHLRLRLRERDGDLCWICGKVMVFGTRKNKPDVASIDHIIPKVHGGPTTMANLKLAHRLCNNRRGSPKPVKQEAAPPVESPCSRTSPSPAGTVTPTRPNSATS